MNKYVKAGEWFIRQRITWSILLIEYTTLFGACNIDLLNKVENEYEGSLFMVLVLFTFYFHTHIGIDWLEDICNGDMNRTTKYFFGKDVFLFNIATYMGQIVNISILFLYQFYFFTLTVTEVTNKNAILRYIPMIEELPENWYAKSWLKWHVVDLN